MKKAFKITYIVLGASALIAFVPSIVWAASDTNNFTNTSVEDAQLILSDNVQLEYVENETFNPTGISIAYNNKVVEASELTTINYDFSISGTRVVELINEIGKKQYRALLPVTVYHIRHLDVRNSSVSKKSDGTWDSSKLIVWAELNDPAKTLEKPAEFSSPEQTVVILNENQYTLSMVETTYAGKYEGTVYAGKTMATFTYYDELEFNQDRVLTLINTSGTADRLTLFVETNTNDFVWPDGTNNVECTGTYVFSNAYGSKTNYGFSFILEGWTSNFRSNSVDWRVNDSYGATQDSEGYTCVINGITFYAVANAWHLAILGR